MAKDGDHTYTNVFKPDPVSPFYQPSAEKFDEEHTYETIPIDDVNLNKNEVGKRYDEE